MFVPYGKPLFALLFACAIGPGVCLIAQKSGERREFRPLYSARAEVEKALGKSSDSCNCLYKTPNEVIRIDYSTGTGMGATPGWAVPKDTVLSYSVEFNLPRRLPDIDDSDDLLKIYSFHTKFDIDAPKGLVYAINDNGEVERILHYPTPADNKLRCKGFPAFDLVSFYYEPYRQYNVQNLQDFERDLIDLIINCEREPDHIAYIIVYDRFSDSDRPLFPRIDQLISGKIRKDLNNLKTVYGGCREESGIDVFFIRKGLPPVIPTPSVGCDKG